MITPTIDRRGGTERSVWEQVSRLRRSFDMRVYTTSAPADIPPGVLHRHVRAIPTPHLAFWCSWVVCNHVARWLDAFRRGAPDLVMSPGINALDADVIGVHILFTQHLEDRPLDREGFAKRTHRWLYFRLLTLLEGYVYSGPALIWAVSDKDAGELEARFDRPHGSVPVVHHGVDPGDFSKVRRDDMRLGHRARWKLEHRRVLLLVGNDVVKKGMDTAIRAMQALPDDVALVIAGLVERDAIRALAEAAGVSDRVLQIGHVDDIVRAFAVADALIAPSREEAFNLPVLEAMSCGLPVVVAASAGISELLTNGTDALVISGSPSTDQLTAAAHRVLDDPVLADSLGRAAVHRARSFTWDASAERVAGILEREISIPRVLVLATDVARTGGIQRVTRTLTHALSEAFGEERIAVASIWRGDQSVAGRILRDGDAMSADGRVGGIRSARYAFTAARIARRWRRRLAIVAAHPHLAPVAWLAHAVSGAPYAVWCHGIEVWGPIGRAARFGIARADRVFAPSRFTADQVEHHAGLVPGSVTVIPHCVPSELAGPEPDPEVQRAGTVLTVARLDPDHAYKGVDTLIEVWPGVVEAVPVATLTIVGDGPDRDRLAARVADLGVASSVEFAGRVGDEELAERYRKASLFAMPARHRTGAGAQGEGFGLVFVEAGAAGVPVVAGRGGGADEAVEDDVSGLLVDPDNPTSVRDAIVRVLTDPSLARHLGKGGRYLATTRYSFEAFRGAVVSLIGELPVKGLFR
jgi:phosphatidylinositol alpha-1,6-mannosyltransferase